MDKQHHASQTSPIELLKDLLIVALLCSAVFLLWESQLLVGFSTSLNKPNINVESSDYGLQVAAARPFRIATISGDNGALYGLQYDDSALDELFLLSSNLLRETFSSLSSPVQISEHIWQSLLETAPGLYLDMAGEIPLSVLTGWLSSTSDSNRIESPIRMLLTVYDGKMALCYQLSNTDFYCCTSDIVDSSRLTALVAQTTPNGAQFAFQSAQLSNLDPYTLLSPTTPTPAVYTASNPISSTETYNQLLELLEFNGQGGSIYTSADGLGIVVRYDADTLRISGSGIVTYESDATFSRYPIPFSQTEPTLFDMVEKCRTVASSALSPFCGEARLQLLDVRQEEHRTMITFGFLLNGTLVQYSDGGEVAQFVVENGKVSAFTLRMRNYVANSDSIVLLPETQAAAAMTALGYEDHDLILNYFDNGGAIISADWTAR